MSYICQHHKIIVNIQFEGKKEVDFATFNKAYRIFETLP